jgi:hypothetical protein
MAESLESVLSLQPDWFRQRITEAAVWAHGSLSKTVGIRVDKDKLWRGEPSPQLRSDTLNPAAFGAASFRGGRENIPTRNAVETLVRGRAELLREQTEDPSTPVNIDNGKLLLFTPEDSLSDGAATVGSEGFFDVDNVPAWDTWLFFDGRTLISWVPPQLIPIVQAGIDVNPEGCIRWHS